MSLFDNLKTQDDINEDGDSVGGGGVVDSGLYPAKIGMAYIEKSKGGALALVLHLKLDQGKEVRQSLWMTSGDSKGNKNYYEKDGEKNYLPGFTLANNLCLLSIGKEVGDVETEEKLIQLWNSEAKKELPTKKPVITGLLGKEIIAGVFRNTVDKTAKGDDGSYYPTGETRDENEVDKFFRARDNKTVAEIRASAEEATFYNTWKGKWTGVTRDRTSKEGKASPGVMQKAAGSSNGAAARKSMFS
jgi:hypothetical protein